MHDEEERALADNDLVGVVFVPSCHKHTQEHYIVTEIIYYPPKYHTNSSDVPNYNQQQDHVYSKTCSQVISNWYAHILTRSFVMD
ncbi:hypothetical protein RhiJN_11290 [Ceratobasidium sp. AG-Ba]|nr:hypothetical protein RhiJN_11290 [Ceratobasidium sp. AG-Ba]